MLDEARKALGRNNVSARAVLGDRVVFVKRYFRHPGDPRDRLGTEFAVLSFLRENGSTCVPEPIAMLKEEGIGVYEFVDGTPLVPGDVTLEDGIELGALLVRMHELRTSPRATSLPIASDAAFSFSEYMERLEARMERVRSAGGAAQAFVECEALPVARELHAWLTQRAGEAGVELEDRSPIRTLSPGDIGFHNAIRRADGSLAFVDFEYGGWDEAAHVIASACVPPGVPLPSELHLPVLEALLERFKGGGVLAVRVRLTYPLLAFKWSLILLNELVGVARERRRYAGALPSSSSTTQVERARAQLQIARSAVERSSFLEALVE